ncbi:hypothetical protein BsWGS_11731 [Bradybaena similaris]
MRQVKQCMSPLQMSSGEQDGIFVFVSKLTMMSKLCSEGKIQAAFSCLNHLYNKCARSKEGTKHFDLLVDVGKWRDAVNKICHNIHYLEDHEECEAQAYQEYKPCADQEVAIFNQQMALTWAEMTRPSNMTEDQRIEAVMDVGFTVNILECLRKPFTKYCPSQLTKLLVETFEDFMLPACVKRALMNTINRIPKYKHISQERPGQENSSSSSNQTSSLPSEVAGASSTPATAEAANSFGDIESDRPNIVHIVGAPLGAGGLDEAVGSLGSADKLDSLSCRLTASTWLAISVLLPCRWLLPF